MPVQVAELQNVLSGMGQQLQAEQGMRRADAQVRGEVGAGLRV